MRDVYILGLGQTEVGEHWETSLRHLAWMALDAALKDAEIKTPDALFVGNVLAGQLSRQEHLGVLIADFSGLRGIEAATVEAAGASGGMAARQAYLAVASGMVDTALAVGVEKFTDTVGSRATAALTSATDTDWEAAQGATPTAIAALIMRRYMHEFDCTVADFAGFSVNAHANAKTNPNAMFHNTITAEAFAKAPMVADPVNMFDTAPDADGAAAVLLIGADALGKLGLEPSHPLVRIAGSAVATDSLALHDRPDPLFFRAANLSAGRAYKQAGVEPKDISVLELHDAYTVYAALSLEAGGFAPRGMGWRMAMDGGISLKGRTPLSTFGGLKARGNPGGATGVYQIVEAALQLRSEAGANQVADPHWALAQCLGGAGATAVTHILQRMQKV
ncbi:MAG TPA: thiolase domain-containing protein [Anaerolineales bacterium]|nr:thiolase domain-containing protein [Anaerolineales bacterium]